MRIATHPGKIFREESLRPLGLSARRLASEIGTPQKHLSEIVRGRRSVTADAALRLARRFNTTPLFWMNLQAKHALQQARTTICRSNRRKRHEGSAPQKPLHRPCSPASKIQVRSAKAT
jgi:addiction module HigA family antidote